MPMLPIIDLLIFMGWSTLTMGGVLKAVYMTTHYRPTILSLTPMDCLVVASMFLLFALTLAARTWVKANDPAVLAAQRAHSTLEAYQITHANAQRDEIAMEERRAVGRHATAGR